MGAADKRDSTIDGQNFPKLRNQNDFFDPTRELMNGFYTILRILCSKPSAGSILCFIFS
jgi:hypothetical protein